MKETHSVQAGSSEAAVGACWWVWVLVGAVLVGLAAVSAESLWIDEALTAGEISQATPGGVWRAAVAEKASDLQMPFYLAYLWGFAKIFGTGEWTLRAANIPWFAAGVAFFCAAFSKPARFFMAAMVLASPFAWYYLNEARPYVMQLSASLTIFAATYYLFRNTALTPRGERVWAAAFLCGLVVLCGSSLLGMIWAAAVLPGACLLVGWPRFRELARRHWLGCLLALVSAAALGIYYCWTLQVGARATPGKTNGRNLAFAAYELLGFEGLGPGRLEIRNGGFGGFTGFVVPLGIYGALIAGLAMVGFRRMVGGTAPGTALGPGVMMGVPALILTGAGWILHFRILGRHFTPLLPVVIFGLGLGAFACWGSRKRMAKMLVVGFVSLSLVSCLELRFGLRHRKDDYRAAAAVARQTLQQGGKVWWDADRHGAAYYELPLGLDAAGANESLWVVNRGAGALAALPVPDLIVVSKPDLFDGQGAVAAYLRNGPYIKAGEFRAFIIWRRAGVPAGAPSPH